MLPFDTKPWAKQVATIVVTLSVIAAVVAAYYLHDMKMLHIPETLILVLLLLTIVPPNLAIIRRKRIADEAASEAKHTAQTHVLGNHAH